MENPFLEIQQRLDSLEKLVISTVQKRNGSDEKDDYLSVSDVADLLGITPNSIYRLVMLRKIPHRKVNKLLYFSRREMHDFIESGKRPVVFT